MKATPYFHAIHGPSHTPVKWLASALFLLIVAPNAMSSTLTYPRSETLDGWHERVYTTTWTDLAPDVSNLIVTDSNGDLRGFDNSSSPATAWLQSPAFVLEAGAITISQIYLLGSAIPAPESDADVSGDKSFGGWAGIGLRDTAGNFVLTFSDPTVWGEVTFSSEALQQYVGQTFTLDFINMDTRGDALYVNRPITIEGTPSTISAVPEPASLLSMAGLLGSGLLFRRRGLAAI